MNNALPLIAAALLSLPVLAEVQKEPLMLSNTDRSHTPIHYPETKTVKQVDDFHGVKVADPYRWLEADVRNDASVAAWVKAQNTLTFDYLANIPAREKIKTRMRALWDYEKYSTPSIAGGKYFYFKNNGLQNQSVLYYQDELHTQAKVALDPNTWSKDGTIALAGVKVSPNGRYLAYSIQDGGTDWRTWKIKDLKSGKILKDELKWIKFSEVSWSKDNKGFFYSRYPTPSTGEEFQSLNKNHKVYYHQLGKAQDTDRLVYERPEHPDWGYSAEVTDDGRYLLITIWVGTDNRYRLVYLDLTQPKAKPVDLVSEFKYDFDLLGNSGESFYFKTTQGAPKGRIIAINLSSPEEAKWKVIVAEQENVLDAAAWVGPSLITQYLKDARSLVKLYSPAGKFIKELDLPGIGSVNGLRGSPSDSETFYSYSSFNAPPTIYRLNLEDNSSSLYKAPKVAFKPEDYVVKQVFYSSKDGTKVPMFIAHKKDLKLDGKTPTLLYGYGGFNISLEPAFSITRLAWMEMGGVYAVPNLRGGGEYGEAWHKAGTKLQKQNVFDDFIAAAEYLVTSGYTNAAKLAIMGRSNGGLLVGAVTAQRPDLFAAALPGVGVMDMLRFHQFTAGRYWVDDYGSAQNPEEFKALYAYSPYHNLKPGTAYPATLVTTADTDDRVVPGHSFKYLAALQKAQAGKAPVLIRIETRAGHGAGKPTEKVIEEYADSWAFLAKNLGLILPSDY